MRISWILRRILRFLLHIGIGCCYIQCTLKQFNLKLTGCFRFTDGDSVFAVLKSYTSSHIIVSAWAAKPILSI